MAASLRGGGCALPCSTPERLSHWRGGTGVDVEMVCAWASATRSTRKRRVGMRRDEGPRSAREPAVVDDGGKSVTLCQSPASSSRPGHMSPLSHSLAVLKLSYQLHTKYTSRPCTPAQGLPCYQQPLVVLMNPFRRPTIKFKFPHSGCLAFVRFASL
jgi:hypothetical protein